jgi:hypothetical protein
MHLNKGITDDTYAVLSDKDTHERISGFGASGETVETSALSNKREIITQLRDLLKKLEDF